MALTRWRGEPLADCSVTAWAAAEIVRLREARASAEESLAAALCLAGQHVETIGGPERLVALRTGVRMPHMARTAAMAWRIRSDSCRCEFVVLLLPGAEAGAWKESG